jgi:Protein of unknown function (DUF3532).
MAKPIVLDDEEFERQLLAARQRFTEEHAAGLHASSVRYDKRSRRFIFELSNGYLFGVPVATLPHLAEATPAQLAAIELTSSGASIRIPALDADYSVPALILALTAREIGRRGGQVRSKAKSLAAKANGAKGGRPRRLAELGGSEPDLRPIPRRRSRLV